MYQSMLADIRIKVTTCIGRTKNYLVETFHWKVMLLLLASHSSFINSIKIDTRSTYLPSLVTTKSKILPQQRI